MKDQELRDKFHAYRPQIDDNEAFMDKLMAQMDAVDEQQHARIIPFYRRILPWVAGVAAASVLLLTLHRNDNHVDPKQVQPVVTQKTEQKDSTLKTEKKEPKPMIAQENPATDKTRAAIQRRTATVVAHKVSTTIPVTDSLDYYIDKIERELAQVDESIYIERMNKVIRADERLQRIVNSYILHTLDKEGRPQTAEIMYNVKTEEDEE
jgi:hypothetical protein